MITKEQIAAMMADVALVERQQDRLRDHRCLHMCVMDLCCHVKALACEVEELQKQQVRPPVMEMP